MRMTISPPQHTSLPSGAREPRPLLGAGIICFTLVTFGAAGGLVALQQLLGLDLVIIEIVQLAPTIGVLAVLLLGLLLRRPVRDTQARPASPIAPRMLLAVLLPIMIMTVASLGFVLTSGDVALVSPLSLSAPFALILMAQLVGACAEEYGWRGYLQPTLQRRIGLVPAAVVIGILWGAWHIQIFSLGAAYVAAFLLSTVAMSIIMAVLNERLTWGRTLVAGVFHFVINIGMLLSLREESGDVASQLWIGVACALAAAGLLIPRLRSRSADPRR